MALNKELLKTGLIQDLVGATSIANDVEIELNNKLKNLDGGFRTALLNIKARSTNLDFSDPNFYSLAQIIVAEEFSKTISAKLAETIEDTFLPKLAELIATSVAERVDAYVREIEVKSPAGQEVQVQITGNSGNGTVTTTADISSIN